jgi:MFS family permease
MTMTTPETFAARAKSPAGLTLRYSLALSFIFLAIMCLAYAINAADRQIFPTLLPAIRQAFGYDLKVAGLMSTIFTLGLAVAGIPTGYILDRTSRKAIILFAMVVYSVFTLATIYAYGFWDMLFYRAMTGVGEGMQMAGLFAAIGAYFYQKRSFFIGWLILAYGVGAFLGPRLGAMLSHAANNWQTPFVWFAVSGLVIAAIVLLAVPKGFTESEGPAKAGPVEQSAFAYMPANLWNRNVIMGSIGCIILGYSLYGYIGLYTTYLQSGLKFAPADAAAALSFFGLGGLLSFVGGWFGDRFPQHWVMAISFAVLAAVGYSIYNVATSLQAQSFLSFMTGAVGSGFVFVNLLSFLQRSVRPQMVGRASGIFLTTLFGAASTAGYLMGALVGGFGWGTAALIELTLFPIVGIIAMVMVDPKQLIPVAKKA